MPEFHPPTQGGLFLLPYLSRFPGYPDTFYKYIICVTHFLYTPVFCFYIVSGLTLIPFLLMQQPQFLLQTPKFHSRHICTVLSVCMEHHWLIQNQAKSFSFLIVKPLICSCFAATRNGSRKKSAIWRFRMHCQARADRPAPMHEVP